ncbi:MAG: Methionine-tRNA ligase [candidate division CPR2 bacterium GW2011_GWC1_39_9]|nr:MAG: Methionine-tRNA ligase [candidate division CPR2 bacterium GW2011_GWC1_39_9]
MTDKQKILIGGAWPYANGSLHIGHVAALIGGDILARYYRLSGNDVLYVSGSDQHGTPIAVRAEKEGVPPSKIADRYHREFVRDFTELGFSYDLYTKTTTDNHEKVVQDFFLSLHNKGLIYAKSQTLPHCPNCRRFLPDRYVEGICPVCKTPGARGDQCDECGSLLDTTELLNPQCKICGTTPEFRESEHFFLKLSHFEDFLKEWVPKQKGWRQNAANFTRGLLKKGLKDRPITRDTQWGIKIPIEGYDDKRIYVWFEAVIGYVSASIEWANAQDNPDAWIPFWTNGAKNIYAHGKDNIPFHTIIWPAILKAKGGLNLPSQIVSTEYVTLERKQLSTSRNWAVWVPNFLENYDPDTLRYYVINNGPETSDADFTWQEYLERTNGDLVGVYGNFVHRILSFIFKNFGDKIPTPGDFDEEDKKILKATKDSFKTAGQLISDGKFRAAIKEIIGLARLGNQYVDKKAPWSQIKVSQEAAATTLWVCAQVIRSLGILTQPFIPRSSQVLLETIKVSNIEWRFEELPAGSTFKEPKPLFQRLDKKIIEEEIAKLEKAT